jgi:hypothetical protein
VVSLVDRRLARPDVDHDLAIGADRDVGGDAERIAQRRPGANPVGTTATPRSSG